MGCFRRMNARALMKLILEMNLKSHISKVAKVRWVGTLLVCVWIGGGCEAPAKAPQPATSPAPAAMGTCGNEDAMACFITAIQNKDIEKLEGSCSVGNGLACRTLGKRAMEDLLGLPSLGKRDQQAAVGYFERGCTAGNGASCGEAARMYTNEGSPVAVDKTKADALWNKGCEAGDIESCLRVAESQATMGEEGKKRASSLLTALVALRNGPAWSFETFSGEVPAESEAVARPLFTNLALYSSDQDTALMHNQQGCEEGEGIACGRAGAVMMAQATDEPGREAARAILRRGCTAFHSPSSCVSLVAMEQRQLTPAVLEENRGYLTSACVTSELACELLGDMLNAMGDVTGAQQRYAGACRGGRQSACAKQK